MVFHQHHRAVQGREHAAAVDIAHEQHGCVCELRHAHIHDVILFQVDFRRAARAFYDDDVILSGKTFVSLAYCANPRALAAPVFFGGLIAGRLAQHNNLRTTVARRL